ncbi:hypothetical protein SNE35_09330 [Paucibacter sp. R3-3]|uniref:Uncharacterized protein n=1 Tax=Roseateles agri TaxID=3098619 RepID=A0ABU5DEJ9_9BURK|nr:hypothetical protein [Paucibacter sp. R3-3]MDY0744709.1 hypothetical protein [Paucibacter sp. R3-3]
MPTNKMSSALAAACALMLSACGGGGSSSDTPAPPVTPAALTIGGTAATGAAMAGASVQIKCAGGSGSATSATDGSFSTSITDAALPCALSATSSDGKTTLRSVAPAGTATSATANITPLSEIIVAQVAGGDAGALFSSFDAAAQAKLSSTNVASAVTTVAAALKGTIDLSGVNPLSDALVATGGGKTGNALDQKLDALGAALKAGGSSVADVAAALLANPGAPAVVQTLLQPAATSCAALRSGKFHLLDAYDGERPVSLATVDASALTVKEADGTILTFAPVSGSACAYTAGDGKVSAYVAKSGVIVVRYLDDAATARAALLVPDQSVPLSEMAGTWNIAIYGIDEFGGPAAPYFSVQTLDKTSLSTAGADCVGLNACESWIPRATDIFTVDTTEGGFTHADDEGSGRLFPVKTATGQIALFGMLFDTQKRPIGLVFFSKQTALSLPTVGAVDNFWDMQVNSAGIAQAVADTQTTIQSVDTSAGSYTRIRTSDGRVDGFTLNKPRDGMRYRAAGSSVGTNGKTITFGATLNTPLPGMGLTVYSSLTTDAATNFFGISIGKP